MRTCWPWTTTQAVKWLLTHWLIGAFCWTTVLLFSSGVRRGTMRAEFVVLSSSLLPFISAYLEKKGLAPKQLSFCRSARMFETFGSFVPNADTRRISFKSALISGFFHASVENTGSELLFRQICIYIPDFLFYIISPYIYGWIFLIKEWCDCTCVGFSLRTQCSPAEIVCSEEYSIIRSKERKTSAFLWSRFFLWKSRIILKSKDAV